MKIHTIAKLCLLSIFCLVSIGIYAQERTVSGKVLDELGEPIPGASVYIQNQAGKGTTTDVDGLFTIKTQLGDKLQFSFVGYVKQTLLVTEETVSAVIKLVPDTQSLSEVVVEAYGNKTRKITMTGAVTSVDVATLQTPATNLANMLGGRVAGIISTMGSGEPGKNISEFWVRGIGTFGASSSALVLIDGLEGSLNDVDPADVESFSVLKDASSTAMYGVRGANGVVLVTTKRGKDEKLRFTARANVKLSWLKRLPEYCQAYDYAKLVNEAMVVRGDKPKYTGKELEIMQNGLDPDLYPDVNWQDEILNDASWQQTYFVSAQGGGSIARYYLSLNYSNESSAYKQDKASKYFKNVAYNTMGIRSNIDINLTKSTVLYYGMNINKTFNTLPGSVDTNQLWYTVNMLTPLSMPVKYSNGMLPSKSGLALMSPYVRLNHTGMQKKEFTTGTYTLSLKQDLSMITSGLDLDVQGAFTNQEWFEETRYIQPEMWYYDSRDSNGYLSGTRQAFRETTSYRNWQDQYRKYFLQANIRWRRQVRDAHNFFAMVHYEMSDQKRVVDATNTMSAIPVRYQGISSKVSYNYKEIYLIDANFGYTGSENFQPGRQFGFFPSISGGWVPSNYDWMKNNVSWLNYFKIRASYGLVGNDRISNRRFPYLTTINENTTAHTAWGYIKGGIWENVIGADNLKWEKAKKFDIGVEGTLFKNFEFVVDYFRDTRDGIFQERKQVPEFVGLVNMPYGNVGSMVSWGADGNFTYTHKFNKDMNLTVRGNFTYSTNKVNYFEEADTKYAYYSTSNRPLDYRKGYVSLGLFRDQEEIDNSPLQTFGEYLPGDIKYKDINGDGVIDSDDQVPLSFADYPRFMYGFGGEFRWKNLTLGVLFKGIGNTDYYRVWTGGPHNAGIVPFHDGETGNILTIAADPRNRWIPADYNDPSIPAELRENPNAMFPRLRYGFSANNGQTSNFWRGNRRYLRLEELSLYYNLAPMVLKRMGINSIDLGLVANNLYTWDNVKLFDPEQAGANGRVYPIPATVTLQATVHF